MVNDVGSLGAIDGAAAPDLAVPGADINAVCDVLRKWRADFTIAPHLRPGVAQKMGHCGAMKIWTNIAVLPLWQRFALSEAGTLAVTRVFVVGACLALAVTVASIVFVERPPEVVVDAQAEAETVFRLANGGRDRATVLAQGPRGLFSPNEMRRRYDVAANPELTTERRLRDDHRTWVRRIADPSYSQPGRARDMVLILEMAMDARFVEPHRGF